MATTLKLYQAVRKNFVSIQFTEDQRWFQLLPLFDRFTRILGIISECIYFFYVANTPEELMNLIFMTTVAILVLISVLDTSRKMEVIFFLMDQVEMVVNKSEPVN